MDSINDKYLEVLSKCHFVAKPNTWFINGTRCQVELDSIVPNYTETDKFNNASGFFSGILTIINNGCSEIDNDEELCSFDEFDIYDNFGNNISELTLVDYEILLKNKK